MKYFKVPNTISSALCGRNHLVVTTTLNLDTVIL